MKIYEVRERTPRLVADLLDIWEVFVRATHHFLSDARSLRSKNMFHRHYRVLYI